MSGKRADSIRSLGYDHVQLDRPTKLKLKALAQDSGKTLCEYLRDVANSGPDIQGQMMRGSSITELRRKVDSIDNRLNDFNFAIIKLCDLLGISPGVADAINKRFPAHDHGAEFTQDMRLIADRLQSLVKTDDESQLELK